MKYNIWCEKKNTPDEINGRLNTAGENVRRSQGNRTHSVQRNKDENDSRLWDHGSCEGPEPLQHWKKKHLSTQTSAPCKNVFQNEVEIKTFSDTQTLKEFTTGRLVPYVRNTEGSPSERREMTLAGNMDPHKGTETTRNGSYMDKHRRAFSYHLNLFKIRLTV